MKILKGVLAVVVLGLVVIQFIRPTRHALPDDPSKDFVHQLRPPQQVETILRASCYDCHSFETRYPWYAEVQPVGWWMDGHIQTARRELNFSEFGSYRLRRRFIKLQQMGEQVDQGDMPLPSYLIIHTDAKLSQEQKDLLIQWVNATRDSIAANAPPDSLARRQQ